MTITRPTADDPTQTAGDERPTRASAATFADRSLSSVDLSHVRKRGEINLRRWFAAYLLWLGALGALVYWGRWQAEAGSHFGFVVMCLAGYMLYLSLCNVFVPAPTTWIVMLVASNELSLIEPVVLRVVIVSLLGGIATAMANLSEYHVLTFLLRVRWIGRLREARAVQWAVNWFAVSPFTLLTLFAFVPIPVDVVRWLAITARYSRVRFFFAYLLGRTPRYVFWAITAVGLALTFWEIMAIQVGLVALALVRIVYSVIQRRRRRAAPGVEGMELGS